MRMLLHVCCGPCACGSLPVWHSKQVEVLGFFYNPNIHPLMEFRRRLEGAKETFASSETALIVDATYDPQAWFAAVSGAEETRCRRCIGMRMDRAAVEAVAQGCDTFSTTLSISPWQDHETIRNCGAEAATVHGVDFCYEDLRPHYAESRRVSRERGVYRQKYCGCLVSEAQRYAVPGMAGTAPAASEAK